MLLYGGRCRVLIDNKSNPGITYVISGVESYTGVKKFQTYNKNFVPPGVGPIIEQLIQVYGTVQFETFDEEKYISVGSIVISANDDFISSNQVFEECGFVEGVARITTPVGDAACVVKNGTLYPILTEYDQATEDNWTLQDVYLNGDNEVSNLQQMVDRSGTYLAYTEDQEADKWSPIENYLHMHVKMPIVPKIGFVPAQQVGLGNVLPGLNYAVTL